MYAIYGNFCHLYTPNVSICTIHTDPMGMSYIIPTLNTHSFFFGVIPFSKNTTRQRIVMRLRIVGSETGTHRGEGEKGWDAGG